MKKIISWGHKKITGFSLLELMVVVAILGVLATVAVPRFNIFRARARQSESKTNLGVIYSLQEAFNIDHEKYYDGIGGAAGWGGTNMNSYATADGYRGHGVGIGSSDCQENKLGFRMANCEKARYMYWMHEGNENSFTAIAHGTSDQPGTKRIFPGCDGTDNDGAETPGAGGASVKMKCRAVTGGNLDQAGGDTWCLDEARNLQNYRDITEHCDN